ncbi:hypothetical protein C5167_040587 [Papaver somniferum]|uniref:Uncharacterized protein n=1 Tax=Papaver somniferum TaxID=3469 RepID=A0A4Y7IFD8_PAPSO|nr:hypothetical protein C5167_040587 [Papaver somniferum]
MSVRHGVLKSRGHSPCLQSRDLFSRVARESRVPSDSEQKKRNPSRKIVARLAVQFHGGLEAYRVVVKLKKTKTTSPTWECNWCLQDACEVPSRSVVGSQASEAKRLHLLMSSTHHYAL